LFQTKAELKRAQSRLRTLGGRPGDHRRELILTAPGAGVVTAINVGMGAYVSDPTAVLMSIANLDDVFVTANVPEADIAAIKVGSHADITLAAYNGRVIKGAVSSINALIEPDTRRLKVRVRLNNADGALKPNMFATLTLATNGGPAISVPQSALLMNNDATSILVETRPWTFERRQVQIGEDAGNQVYVLSGVKSGERVVVKGGVLLDD
jgi:cobalt-zinc-cadmium efflux system membrane fusion protein